MSREVKQIIMLCFAAIVLLGASFIVMSSQESSIEIDTHEKVSYISKTEPENNQKEDVVLQRASDENSDSNKNVAEEPKFEAEDLTVLILGQDFVEGLTDVIMVGHFSAETGEVKIVSVPRDFYIDFRNEPFKSIRQGSLYPNMPLDQKLTEVYFNQFKTNDAIFVVRDIVSGIIGTEIDYTVAIDTGGFREVVDLVGGVEIYVPHDMKKEDPLQGLKIDLEEGLQILDGDKAEQFVRYREYAWGDLDRISNQQVFVDAFVDQVIVNGDVNELIALTTKGYQLIKSDFGLGLVLEYVNYLVEIDLQEMMNADNMITLKMSGIVNIDGREALSWDVEETHRDVNELFFSNTYNE